MKKYLSLLLTGVMTLGLTACSSSSSAAASSTAAASTTAAAETEVTRIALVLPYVGDQSYFDVTYNGLTLLEEKYGDAVETKLIEMGTDTGGWETAYRQAATDGYDIIISGNFQYEPYMLKVAADYPDIKFLNFDYSDAALNTMDNVYAITYASNQIGYIAGIVAGVKTESNIVGCIGGMELDGIKQFLAGFMQGVTDVNPDCKVISGFVGDFQDTGKAKELALSMNSQGADVIYHAAGGAGNGMFEAAAEKGFWAIGVDSDQYAIFAEEKPEIAKQILTSAEKKCDQGILGAITEMLEGTAEYGTQKTLTLADNGVGLAENDNYKANMTEEEQATVEEYLNKVKDGTTQVVDQLVDNTVYDTYLAKTALN